MGKEEPPKIIDAEYEIVSEPLPDRRPFWQKYEITFDWRAGMIGGALALMGALATMRH